MVNATNSPHAAIHRKPMGDMSVARSIISFYANGIRGVNIVMLIPTPSNEIRSTVRNGCQHVIGVVLPTRRIVA